MEVIRTIDGTNVENDGYCEELKADFGNQFKHTLPGLLNDRINRLINRLIIFSFYGSGYDMVLLEGYILPLLYERKMKPELEKKGEKVTRIKCKNGVEFRDVTKLLAPNTNLRSFGELFNLPVSKGYFPFHILNSVQSLLRPSLPATESEWESTLLTSNLGKPKLTQNEIDVILKDYEDLKFQNVGEYLKHYLKDDVRILYQATNLWRIRLKGVLHSVDFMDIAKYTISGLSSFASSNRSAQRQSFGWFFPNNTQHYALLKKGMRG